MISLTKKHNDIMDTVEACKLLTRILVCKGDIVCADFCKHYDALNRKDYVLCPAELKGGTTANCATEILKTVAENPEKFKKLLEYYINNRYDGRYDV